MASVTVDQLDGEIERIRRQVAQEHLKLQATLAGEVIAYLGQNSPVLTGAYRASHTVTKGSGEILYKGEDHVPDDLVVPVEPRDRYTPANGADAYVAARDNGTPYTKWWIRNGRYYADWVENKYSLYAMAETLAESIAERLAAVRSLIR